VKRRITAGLAAGITAAVLALTAVIPAAGAMTAEDALRDAVERRDVQAIRDAADALRRYAAPSGTLPDGFELPDIDAMLEADGITFAGRAVYMHGITFEADLVIIRSCRRFVYAEGNARVTDAGRGITLRADSIRYDLDLRAAELGDNASVSFDAPGGFL